MKITAELLDDILNLQYVVLFNEQGITLFSHDVADVQIPDLLVSGLLQAILAMIHEIKPKSDLEAKERLKVNEIAESNLTVYFCQSQVHFAENEPKKAKNLILALFCNRQCSYAIKKRIRETIVAFQNQFETEVKNFNGNMAVFNNAGQFFDEHFGLAILNPICINQEKITQGYDQLSDNLDIIELVESQSIELVEGEGFFLKDLVDKAIRTIRSPYFIILNKILLMFKAEILYPLNGKVFTEEIYLDLNVPEALFNPVEQNVEPAATFSPLPYRSIQNEQIEMEEIAEDETLEQETNDQIGNFVEISKSSPWYANFVNELIDTPEPKIRREALLEASLIREGEYKGWNFQKKFDFQVNKLSESHIGFNNFVIQKMDKNLHNGPLWTLNNTEQRKEVLISGIKNKEKAIVLVFM